MSEQHGHSPLAQFEVFPLLDIKMGGLDLSFTNASLFMVLAMSGILFFLIGATRRRALVPGRWQCAAEMVYDFIGKLLKENVGNEGRRFFPLVFSLFLFVLTLNLLGMMPYGFTVTSHVAVTFAMSIVLFLFLTVYGFVRHGTHFLRMFLPEGTPIWMAPMMILVELFAYLARPFSLSIRLTANMFAGHVIMKVIAGFVIALGFLAGWLPFAFLLVFTGFEIFVAVLQAYIFTVLLCVYINDSVNMH